MGLPAELRNIIYEYAMPLSAPVIIRELSRRVATEPGLLHASRQIRREAAPIHYSQNSFIMELSVSPDEMAWTVQKLRSIVDICGPEPFRHFQLRIRGPIREKFYGLLPLLGESPGWSDLSIVSEIGRHLE